MNFFLYEFITGGGLLAESQPPSDSLLAEGRAMISALAEDFSRLGDVTVMLDDRLESFFHRDIHFVPIDNPSEEQATYRRLVTEADWTLIVAPEFDGILRDRVNVARSVRKHVLNCSLRTIQIAANKQQTAELLATHGVPIPIGQAFRSATSLPHDIYYPAMVKPIDGAGSQAVNFIRTHEELLAMNLTDRAWRVERFYPGIAASCAVLCGPRQHIVLPACSQRLSEDGTFAYVGGSVPIDSILAERAQALALRAVAALPEPLGYVGVDLVLGDVTDGTEDYVIEINPRLTTSYVGLQKLARTNLAAAILAVARDEVPEISWHDGAVEFLADGTIIA